MTRPTIAYGSRGSFVEEVQACLEIPIDGAFGQQTERAVQTFQTAQRLESDGVVGPKTWDAFESVYGLPPYPPLPPEPIDETTTAVILAIAERSAINNYDWQDRGQVPTAYAQGIAYAFADAVCRYNAGDSMATECAKADTGDDDVDALAWYADQFNALGMDNSAHGIDTLRHLFVMLMGLGVRESSGIHCEGRDMSATNVSAETAEAGLFQQSWNSSACSDELQKLMDQYASCPSPQCGLEIFEKNVQCSSSDWQCYGSGDGYRFQQMAKQCPVFAVHCAAVGLRNLRQHWGPINRGEVEIMPEADQMLAEIQELVTPATV